MKYMRKTGRETFKVLKWCRSDNDDEDISNNDDNDDENDRDERQRWSLLSTDNDEDTHDDGNKENDDDDGSDDDDDDDDSIEYQGRSLLSTDNYDGNHNDDDNSDNDDDRVGRWGRSLLSTVVQPRPKARVPVNDPSCSDPLYANNPTHITLQNQIKRQSQNAHKWGRNIEAKQQTTIFSLFPFLTLKTVAKNLGKLYNIGLNNARLTIKK